VPLLQHPTQVVGSHTQELPTQCSPLPQAVAPPHPQVPFVRQVFALSGSQVVHIAPPPPQWVRDGVWHASSKQQPPSQLDAVHEGGPHEPATQVLVLHCTQAPPPDPQLAGEVPATHAPLEQQPVGQVLALQPAARQPPSLHPPEAQVAHVTPARPHALAEVPERQLPAVSQQPLAQLVVLHELWQVFC
jgi:hypothetical protein